MHSKHLNQDQVRQLLGRAEEIQSQRLVSLDDQTDMEQLVLAAEEAGLQREAVLQALRERISLEDRPILPDSTVFAKSADGGYYPAKVEEVGEGTVDVRFLNGGSTRLPSDDVRPFSVLPGQTLNCPWPDWGWWDCTVLSYDSLNQKVFVTDNWGSEKWFHISDVRIRPPKRATAIRMQMWLTYAAIAIGGGILGMALTRIFAR